MTAGLSTSSERFYRVLEGTDIHTDAESDEEYPHDANDEMELPEREFAEVGYDFEE